MAFHTLVLERKALDVAISKSGNQLAVLSDSDISVYALDLNKRPVSRPSLLWRSDAIKLHCPRHIAFIGDERLFCLTDNWDEDESFLWKSTGEEVVPLGPIVEAEAVSSLISDLNHKTLYIQLQNGTLHMIDTAEDSTDLPPQTSLMHKFSSLAPEYSIATVEGEVCVIALAIFDETDQARTWLSV
jgi:elongator complex protein 1